MENKILNIQKQKKDDIGSINDFNRYINEMLLVWKECHRVLKPNGKLCINVPLMPMLKSKYKTHFNRHIFDIQSSIQNSILEKHQFLFIRYLHLK